MLKSLKKNKDEDGGESAKNESSDDKKNAKANDANNNQSSRGVGIKDASKSGWDRFEAGKAIDFQVSCSNCIMFLSIWHQFDITNLKQTLFTSCLSVLEYEV